MIVVGVGCGPGMLTEEAIRTIKGAKQIFTSRRSLELVKEHVSEGCEVSILVDYSKIGDLPEDAVVLSTGDPMLAGLGKHGGRIVPGISSLQVAAARLGIDMSKISVVDGHGKSGYLEDVADELSRNKVVFLLADPGTDLHGLSGYLSSRGISGKMALCQDLGYPHEVIVIGTMQEPPSKSSPMFSVVLGCW